MTTYIIFNSRFIDKSKPVCCQLLSPFKLRLLNVFGREDKRHPVNISNGKSNDIFKKCGDNENVNNENSTQPCVRRACHRLLYALPPFFSKQNFFSYKKLLNYNPSLAKFTCLLTGD